MLLSVTWKSYMKSSSEILEYMENEGLTKFTLEVNSVDEIKLAKKKIILHQKKLRQVKREVNDIQKIIRAAYSQKNQSAGTGGSTILSVFGKRKLAGSWRAAAKSDLRAERDSLLQPYNALKSMSDELIQKLDGVKIQCDEYVLSNT